MKAILVLLLVSLAAASSLAYGEDVIAATVAFHGSSSDEPVALLLAGSLLIGVAGALRRFAL